MIMSVLQTSICFQHRNPDLTVGAIHNGPSGLTSVGDESRRGRFPGIGHLENIRVGIFPNQ
jgi:hypothetical protein